MNQAREVVVTGVGVVCPVGIGAAEFEAALAEGRSGIGPLTRIPTENLPVRFGGEIRGFEPKQYVKPRKSLKVMCREIQTGYTAAELAMQDAGLPRGAVDPQRLGVVFGSELFYCAIEELKDTYRGCMVDGTFDFSRWGEAMHRLHPLSMLKYLPNMPACQIGIAQDARGPNNSIVLGDVSALLAVAEASGVIRRGQADVMIAGGTGSRINLVGILNRGDGDLSHRADDPQGACRPFERDRDGIVNGEGAGALVLEDRSHAESRGAAILARVAGFSSTFQAPQGNRQAAIERSITQGLRAAGVSPDEVGHVSADGLSTIEDDAIEAGAIAAVLDDAPVFAAKSYFGHLGTGSGAVEAVASVLALRAGRAWPTLNYHHRDPRCPINVLGSGPLATRKRAAVVLSQARTGQAAALVLMLP